MAGYNPNNFNDRAAAAAKAKQALIERFKAMPGPDDPAVQAAAAERKAIAEARDKRNAERKATRIAEEARLKAEAQAAAIEKARAEAEAKAEAAARQRALLAEQKAARDARYAARKARK
jgi:hypothetical protein